MRRQAIERRQVSNPLGDPFRRQDMRAATVGLFIVTLAWFTTTAGPGSVGEAWGQTKAKPKPNPAFAEVKDDPSLPRVLLIGDSISIGYTVPVRKLLQGKANVH